MGVCQRHQGLRRRRWRPSEPVGVRGLRRPARFLLLRSLHRFSAFQVAGRRGVPLAFPAGRRLVAVRDLLLVVQEHTAQRPPDVLFGPGFVDVVRDPSPRLPGLAGLTSLGGRGRGGRALAPRGYGRGVQEYQRVSPALEGGVAMPRGVGLGAFVNLPAGPFVPVAAGAAGPHDPPGPVRRPILAAAEPVVLVGRRARRPLQVGDRGWNGVHPLTEGRR